MEYYPTVSVITVVLNNRDLLLRTIRNIREQEYDNLEYIIVDGGSEDGTLEVIEENADIISDWVSEPDKGLYDAMNKGMRMATGDYLWYLNAGDEIFESDTLIKVFSRVKDADVCYGDTMVTDDGGNDIGLRRLRPPENLTWRSFLRGMVVCHQAVIVKKKLAEPYDLSLRIASDYDWVLKILKKSRVIHNTGLIMARYIQEGLSRRNIRKALAERFRVMSKNYGLVPAIASHLLISVRFFAFLARHGRF